MNFLKNANFTTSVFTKENILKDALPIFVMVGKSNVGKSSFINAICNRKSLAKVGNTPGKTRCINYYDINSEFYLVDLPGYGYSKMSGKQKEAVNKLTNDFLESNVNIRHIFFLVDIRHEPTQNDKEMYNWLTSHNIEFTIVANKADKLSKLQVEKNINTIRKVLFCKEDIIAFSSESKSGVDEIVQIIEEKKI